MKQEARFSKTVLEPRFITLQKKFQPAAGPKSSNKTTADTIEKRRKKDGENQQKEIADEFRSWHGAQPVAESLAMTFFSLRDAEGKLSEGSLLRCENATLRAKTFMKRGQSS